MLLAKNETFDGVLLEYSRLHNRYFESRKWDQMSENELWNELCLCILSSNVPYELAQSALTHLIKNGYLSIEWITHTPEAEKMIASELFRPIYLPKKANGFFRKYRFPNVRSKNIFKSARTVASEKDWIHRVLARSFSEENARTNLIKDISGFGLKEASHFLRNIRYSRDLAIIDSHVISFLEEIDALGDLQVKTVTPKIYLELEITLQGICKEYGLFLSILDMAVWNYMRRRQEF
jgi:N-glycosylase/DNA lyase